MANGSRGSHHDVRSVGKQREQWGKAAEADRNRGRSATRSCALLPSNSRVFENFVAEPRLRERALPPASPTGHRAARGLELEPSRLIQMSTRQKTGGRFATTRRREGRLSFPGPCVCR